MILEIIAISIIGTLLHFTYELSGHNKYVGLFSAVNESTWEHIKICLTPTFLLSIVDGYVYYGYNNYFIAKAASLLLIIILIPLIFYTYTYFTKRSILPVDIISFYVVVILSNLTFYTVLNMPDLGIINYPGIILTFAIFGFYMIATLLPLKNFIFKDPITGKYGTKGHKH